MCLSLSELRADVSGERQHFVNPTIFEIDDEFRKQSCGFAYQNCVALQEVAQKVKIKSDIFKKLMSGEKLPG